MRNSWKYWGMACLAAAMTALLTAGPVLAAEKKTKTKILKYDKDGRVIGYESSDIKNKDKAGTSAKSKSSKSKSAKSKSARSRIKGPIFDPDTAFEKGEVIVIDPPSGFSSGIRSLGFSVIETVNITELKMVVMRVKTPAGMSVPKAIKTLRSRYRGLDIDANHQFDPSAGVEFPKKVARALIRWNKVPKDCGKGVKLGMIDAGVDVSHPALKGQDVTFKSFHKKGRKAGPKVHGTSVAAIMVGRPEWGGLLPGATLKAANMFEIDENCRKVGNAIGLLKAANWLISQKVDIINLSVAGANNKVLKRIFDKAQKSRMVMVAAAGNWGRSDKPAYPAAYKGVVAVTALSMDGLIYSKANTGPYIDFAAPGVRVYTAVPGGGGRLQSGTSFATPFISAVMGLEISRGKARNASSLNKILKKYSKDLGVPGRDAVFGWGFVNVKPKC
ncbi:MAG: S8 family serine peptidase [Rhodospirillaceae bacterium]|nr:S8 family serine peptidase [Rhodospirillaceae bacterium]